MEEEIRELYVRVTEEIKTQIKIHNLDTVSHNLEEVRDKLTHIEKVLEGPLKIIMNKEEDHKTIKYLMISAAATSFCTMIVTLVINFWKR